MGLNYMYSIDVISALIVLPLLIMLKGKQKSKVVMYRVYYSLMSVTIGAAIFDIILGYGLSKMNDDTTYIHYLLFISVIYMYFLFIMFPIYTSYVLTLSGINIRLDKNWNCLVYFPILIMMSILLINPFSGIVYTISGSEINYKFSFRIIFYCFMFYYLILWIYFLIKYKKKMNKGQKIYVRAFAILHLIMMLLFALVKFYGIFTFEIAIILIIIIYAVQSPDEYFDKSKALYYEKFISAVEMDYLREKSFSLMFIKINDLDMFFDSYGEDNTNGILCELTDFLSKLDRASEIYRFNRNTFVYKIKKTDELLLQKLELRIRERLKDEFRFGDIVTKMAPSIVTMILPEDAASYEKFLEAIKLIEHSNFINESNVRYKTLIENARETEIIELVRKAIEDNKFQVYYQPIYSTHKKNIVAAEALIRLFDEKYGFISPEEFIPLAERAGLILQIGKFVFTEVCRFYSENELNKKGIEYIEVNLSAVQCMQYKLADEFVTIMHQYGLQSSQINFEITETATMSSNNAVELNINYFVDHGVDLSLDDYGTGYSNISYLYHLPFTIIKIDKGILWSSDKNEKAYITLTNIFKMAKNLRMRVVVEGVETEEHIKKLLELDCDYFQGYYFSKAVAGLDFIKYIDEFKIPEVCLS